MIKLPSPRKFTTYINTMNTNSLIQAMGGIPVVKEGSNEFSKIN